MEMGIFRHIFHNACDLVILSAAANFHDFAHGVFILKVFPYHGFG
ncbi:hypothetical protein ES703_59809 [subsurface metagenome]